MTREEAQQRNAELDEMLKEAAPIREALVEARDRAQEALDGYQQLRASILKRQIANLREAEKSAEA